MARRPTMNHDRDRTSDEGGSKNKFYNPVIYKPLPEKAGSSVTNKLFFSLMSPSRWSLFNPTPEMVGLYGMVGSGNQLVSVPNDLLTYSFKIPVHYSMTSGFVICPIAMNKYLTEVHGYGQLFHNPKCAHCEKSNEHWTIYNERWADLGYDRDRLKSLGQDEYKHLRDNDPILKKAHAEARKNSPQDRYLTQVWDHDKFSGTRPMDEEQTQLQFQYWLAPVTIHTTLQALYKDEIEFYDATAEPGIQIMNAVKDTTKCSGNNLSQTKYTLTPSKVVKYPADWVAYLDNVEVWPDPFGQINLATYEDMKRQLFEASADAMVREDAPVVTTRGFSPPSAPSNPGPASFRQPPPEAPVPPPVAPAMAPTAPSAPVPAAPMPPAPMSAPTAPSAPVPVPPPTAPAMPNFGTAPMAPGMMPDRSGAPGKKHNW